MVKKSKEINRKARNIQVLYRLGQRYCCTGPVKDFIIYWYRHDWPYHYSSRVPDLSGSQRNLRTLLSPSHHFCRNFSRGKTWAQRSTLRRLIYISSKYILIYITYIDINEVIQILIKMLSRKEEEVSEWVIIKNDGNQLKVTFVSQQKKYSSLWKKWRG